MPDTARSNDSMGSKKARRKELLQKHREQYGATKIQAIVRGKLSRKNQPANMRSGNGDSRNTAADVDKEEEDDDEREGREVLGSAVHAIQAEDEEERRIRQTIISQERITGPTPTKGANNPNSSPYPNSNPTPYPPKAWPSAYDEDGAALSTGTPGVDWPLLDTDDEAVATAWLRDKGELLVQDP